MKKYSLILAALVLVVAMVAGCSLVSAATADPVIGSWQQVSVNGTASALVNVLQFNSDNSYTGSTAGATLSSGTWSKSGSTYTLTGTFIGFLSSTSAITPTFTSSNNTMTYTDKNGQVEVYNRK